MVAVAVVGVRQGQYLDSQKDRDSSAQKMATSPQLTLWNKDEVIPYQGFVCGYTQSDLGEIRGTNTHGAHNKHIMVKTHVHVSFKTHSIRRDLSDWPFYVAHS